MHGAINFSPAHSASKKQHRDTAIVFNNNAHGDSQVIADGESSSEVPSFRASFSLTVAPARCNLEDRLRIRHRNPASSDPSIHCHPGFVASERRLGIEATASCKVDIGKVVSACGPRQRTRHV
jgi:hypothetical protein